jgi:hypothetical protein
VTSLEEALQHHLKVSFKALNQKFVWNNVLEHVMIRECPRHLVVVLLEMGVMAEA